METEHVLEVNHLSVDYTDGRGSVEAVRDVSFFLDRGEILGLIGASGSGKSTAVQALTGVLSYRCRMKSGSIRLMGQYLTGEGMGSRKEHQKLLNEVRGKQIATVFQNPGRFLDPTMTVGAQFRESIREHRKTDYFSANREAVRCLKEIGIGNAEQVMKMIPSQLSGGQLQLISIAMALVHHPCVLIADEPFSALDAEHAETVSRIFREIRDSGRSVLLVSHDPVICASLCDRLSVMSEGTIIETGKTADLLENPQEIYTVQFAESYRTGKEKKNEETV